MELIKAFEGRNVRMVTIKGEPWFVAKDVSDVLGYYGTERMLRRVDDEDRKLMPHFGESGQSREMVVINESGLYTAIIGSKKPEAKRFKRWVTSEVLPAIRKTGKYEIAPDVRKRTKEVRNHFTDTLNQHGVNAPIQYIKITGTMKKNAGIIGNKPKDEMTKLELMAIEAAEVLASINMIVANANGYDEVKPICQGAAKAISDATGGKDLITSQS